MELNALSNSRSFRESQTSCCQCKEDKESFMEVQGKDSPEIKNCSNRLKIKFCSCEQTTTSSWHRRITSDPCFCKSPCITTKKDMSSSETNSESRMQSHILMPITLVNLFRMILFNAVLLFGQKWSRPWTTSKNKTSANLLFSIWMFTSLICYANATASISTSPLHTTINGTSNSVNGTTLAATSSPINSSQLVHFSTVFSDGLTSISPTVAAAMTMNVSLQIILSQTSNSSVQTFHATLVTLDNYTQSTSTLESEIPQLTILMPSTATIQEDSSIPSSSPIAAPAKVTSSAVTQASSSVYNLQSNTSTSLPETHYSSHFQPVTSTTSYQNITENSSLVTQTMTRVSPVASTAMAVNSSFNSTVSATPVVEKSSPIGVHNGSTTLLVPSRAVTPSSSRFEGVLSTMSSLRMHVTPSLTAEVNSSISNTLGMNQTSTAVQQSQTPTPSMPASVINSTSVQNLSLSPALELTFSSSSRSTATLHVVNSTFTPDVSTSKNSISSSNVTNIANIPTVVLTSESILLSSTVASKIANISITSFGFTTSQSRHFSSTVLKNVTDTTITATGVLTTSLIVSLSSTKVSNDITSTSFAATGVLTTKSVNLFSSNVNNVTSTTAVSTPSLSSTIVNNVTNVTISPTAVYTTPNTSLSSAIVNNVTNVTISPTAVYTTPNTSLSSAIVNNVTNVTISPTAVYTTPGTSLPSTFVNNVTNVTISPTAVYTTPNTSLSSAIVNNVTNVTISPTVALSSQTVNATNVSISPTTVLSTQSINISINASVMSSILPSTQLFVLSGEVTSTVVNVSRIYTNVTLSVNFTRDFTLSVTPSMNFTMSTINSSLNYSLMASSVTPNSTLMIITGSSSISVPYEPTGEPIRTIDVEVRIINKNFSTDLLLSNTSAYVNLSKRVKNAFSDILSKQPGFINITDIRFREGSVVVNFQANFNLSSNVTAVDVKEEILNRNGSSNSENFIFSSDVTAYENCTAGYCVNRGQCLQNATTSAFCRCATGFTGSRCDKVIVHGNYSSWSVFGECSDSCNGGTRRRTRTCTNPLPTNGGQDCSSLGLSYQDEDCNTDVICPIIWIIIAVCCLIFLLLLLLLIICCIKRRKKEKERTYTNYNAGSNMNIIPLEIMVYDDESPPRSSPDGHSNPEFIDKAEETEEDDIYKTQLLLFLKQSHLIKPGMNLSFGDDISDTSDYSNKNSRKASAMSSVSGTAQDEDSD